MMRHFLCKYDVCFKTSGKQTSFPKEISLVKRHHPPEANIMKKSTSYEVLFFWRRERDSNYLLFVLLQYVSLNIHTFYTFKKYPTQIPTIAVIADVTINSHRFAGLSSIAFKRPSMLLIDSCIDFTLVAIS